MEERQERLRPAQTVAVGCDQLPESFHGKEGVDGSSPSEGSAKASQTGALSLARSCTVSNVRWGRSALWSLQVADTDYVLKDRARSAASRHCMLWSLSTHGVQVYRRLRDDWRASRDRATRQT
jgi:hypothetical protein